MVPILDDDEDDDIDWKDTIVIIIIIQDKGILQLPSLLVYGKEGNAK